jgi:hypothetical protein
LEAPGVHSGVRIPASVKVKDAKHDGGKSQRKAIADHRARTGQTK